MMMIQSIENRYQTVRRRMIARFAAGIGLIDQCLGAADGVKRHNHWVKLGLFAHQIAGTAGSFGFDPVGKAALTLEATLTASHGLGSLTDAERAAALQLRAVLQGIVHAHAAEEV